MGPRRRRWRRTAAKAALLALGLTVLGLLGSGDGEELLAAALAAWGEGREQGEEGGEGGDWGMGVGGAGEAWGENWGGVFVNGERGKGAGFVNGERGNGAGFANGGAGLLNGSSGVVTNGGPGGEIGGPGWEIWGPGGRTGGPAGQIGGPGGGIGGPGGGIGGPGGGIGGPGGGIGGPGGGIWAPGGGFGGPGDPHVPPGCAGLLSGGSGDLAEGVPRDPRGPAVLLAPGPCPPPGPFLLILVPSAPAHRERRRAVRDTWGGSWAEPGTPPSRTVFVLGVPPSSSSDSQREVLAESRQHGDILQGDFGDTYANLTRKTLLLLRWARACCGGAPFLLKADDDVFINVPAVATYLATWPAAPARLYLGRVHWAVPPNRDPRSRHHVPAAVYGAARYPPYCSGTAYVLSRQAATAVLAAGRAVPLAMPEDAWVGVAARRAGLAPRHSARFGGALRVPAERCCLGRALLSAHGMSAAALRGAWRQLRERPGHCPPLLRGALGRIRCRAMAWATRLWGTAGEEGMGGDVMGE